MRKEFTITIVTEDDKGQKEKHYKVTDNLAARIILDDRIDGPAAFISKHAESRFTKIKITELTAIAYAMIKGSGYDVTEDDIGQVFVDIGEVQSLKIVLPIIEHWVEKLTGSSKKNSNSQKKPTRSR